MYTASFGGPAEVSPFVPKPTFVHSNPRSVVMINGDAYLPVKWEATKNGHGATDSATITLSIDKNPDFSIELFKGAPSSNLPGSQNFGTTMPDTTPIYVQIFAGYPKILTPGSKTTQGMNTRFLGILDAYSAEFDGDLVTFTCRSLAAPLVDNKLTNAPLGMTSVQFVQAMADSLNLTTAITDFASIGKTPITLQEMLGREMVGGAQFNTALYNLKPWDVALQCAQFDDADVWVDGDTLNYQIVDLIQRNSVSCVYGQNMIRPQGAHSIQGNKLIRVEVRSYQHKVRLSTVTRITSDGTGGVTVTQTSKRATSAPIFGTSSTVSTSTSKTGTSIAVSSSTGGAVSSGFTSPGSESGLQTYKIYRPNISPGAANALAASLWRKYSEQEYTLNFTLSMTPSVFGQFSITSKMAVSGLPYDEFNQSYYPRRYVETYDPESDWSVALECCSIVLANGAV